MPRLYDPISQSVYEEEDPPEPLSLQNLCRQSIIQAVTLEEIQKVNDLPLPTSIKNKVGTVSMKDFTIDVERLSPEHHSFRCYPATCTLTNEEVIIQVFPKNSNVCVSDYDSSMVASFMERGCVCCVLLPTQSLIQKMDKAKESGATLEQSLIWQTLTKVVQAFKSGTISPLTSISSRDVRYHMNGSISVRNQSEGPGNLTTVNASLDKPIYEAPEVLGRQAPDSKAHVWNIGCLLYEMIALEPAFYDGTGVNPFAVFMDIMQGKLPAIPTTASESLTNLVSHCLVSDPAQRMSLEDIEEAIVQHNSTSL